MMLFAANEGHKDIVEYLLGLKADINEVSRVSYILLTLLARGDCTLTSGVFQQGRGGADTYQAWCRPRGPLHGR